MKPFSSRDVATGRVSLAGLLAVAGLAMGLAFAGISVADTQVDLESQATAEPDDTPLPRGESKPPAGRIDANHPLLRSAWLVEDIDNGGVLDRLRTFVQLDENSQASGSTGLNRFGGKVTLDGDKIKFGPMATTRMAGPPAVMDQESKFTKAIARVRGYKIDENGLLRLLDADGKQRMRLSPIPREEKVEKKSDDTK
jgi:heat shock protein HslJ